MICDGCEIAPGARVVRSVLSPGVLVRPGAVVCESILLTETVVEAGAVVERAIVDKRTHIQENARVGGMVSGPEPVITMVGKNSEVPPGFTIEAGAVVGTDVSADDYPSNVVRGEDYIQTKRLAHEV